MLIPNVNSLSNLSCASIYTVNTTGYQSALIQSTGCIWYHSAGIPSQDVMTWLWLQKKPQTGQADIAEWEKSRTVHVLLEPHYYFLFLFSFLSLFGSVLGNKNTYLSSSKNMFWVQKDTLTMLNTDFRPVTKPRQAKLGNKVWYGQYLFLFSFLQDKRRLKRK